MQKREGMLVGPIKIFLAIYFVGLCVGALAFDSPLKPSLFTLYRDWLMVFLGIFWGGLLTALAESK